MGPQGAVSTQQTRGHVPPNLSIQNAPQTRQRAAPWSRKLLRSHVPAPLCTPPASPAPVPRGLTCQAPELSRPQLPQAARAVAVAVGEGLRARLPESLEGQQLGPRLRRPVGHGPGLPAALSRRPGPGRADPRGLRPSRPGRTSTPPSRTGPGPRRWAARLGRAGLACAALTHEVSLFPALSHLGRGENARFCGRLEERPHGARSCPDPEC